MNAATSGFASTPTSTCSAPSSSAAFHVVFDYERSRLILEPNAAFGVPPLTDHAAQPLHATRLLFCG